MSTPLTLLALHGDELLSHLKEASLVRRLDLPSLAIKGALASMVVLGSLLVIAVSRLCVPLQLGVYIHDCVQYHGL